MDLVKRSHDSRTQSKDPPGMQSAIVSKEVFPSEIVEAYLNSFKENNEKLNAYVTVTRDIALASGRLMDQRLSRHLWRYASV